MKRFNTKKEIYTKVIVQDYDKSINSINKYLFSENERLKALLFDKGNIEFNGKEQKCYLKILRHNYCTFIKELERLEQENKQLKDLCNKYEEEHKTTFETWLKEINILTELEQYLIDMFNKTQDIKYCDDLSKIQELKEKYK